MVVNTVLSVLAYNYPMDKLSVYLSDDGGSELTFYALLESSHFARTWIPFCQKFNVETRSPAAYFKEAHIGPKDVTEAVEWMATKNLYNEMENRINQVTGYGRLSNDIRKLHKGFCEWNVPTTSCDHHAIVKILIDGRDKNATDNEGVVLPTLVYMAREKRPEHHHNFKAGAMNSLVGLKYGCPVEDVITGLSIQCRGWKSIYFNPSRVSFLGVAPVTLAQTLVQQKRWSEGDFQIFMSKYNPLLYGHKKIKLGLQLGYTMYCLCAPCSFPTIYYSIISSFSLLHAISLLPSVYSIWFAPFAYVISVTTIHSLWESKKVGYTLKGWWNERRMWLLKRLASYPFAATDALLNLLGINKSTFIVTAKVADEGVLKRYEKEVMEFGSASLMFIILSAHAMFCLTLPSRVSEESWCRMKVER